MLLQIISSYFCAGLVVEEDKVTEAAPIIKYMTGWSLERVISYCIKKKWKIIWVAD